MTAHDDSSEREKQYSRVHALTEADTYSRMSLKAAFYKVQGTDLHAADRDGHIN